MTCNPWLCVGSPTSVSNRPRRSPIPPRSKPMGGELCNTKCTKGCNLERRLRRGQLPHAATPKHYSSKSRAQFMYKRAQLVRKQLLSSTSSSSLIIETSGCRNAKLAGSTRKSVKLSRCLRLLSTWRKLTPLLLVKIATWLQLTKGFSVNVTELRTHTNQLRTQKYKHSFSLSPLHTTGMLRKEKSGLIPQFRAFNPPLACNATNTSISSTLKKMDWGVGDAYILVQITSYDDWKTTINK